MAEPRTRRREQEALNRLDHRDPLVFDTHELGRRPGSMRRVTRTVAAPADLGLDVISVPEGSPIELDLRLESVVEGVLVTGTAHAGLRGECVRCLEPVESELDTEFQELYYYPEAEERFGGRRTAGGGQGDLADEDEDETYRLEGDLFDLQPVLRDAVVLELPLQPVCREDCPGLCSECGARLADDPGHHHDAADPRWAALKGLSAAGHAGGGNDDDSGTGDGAAENQEK